MSEGEGEGEVEWKRRRMVEEDWEGREIRAEIRDTGDGEGNWKDKERYYYWFLKISHDILTKFITL